MFFSFEKLYGNAKKSDTAAREKQGKRDSPPDSKVKNMARDRLHSISKAFEVDEIKEQRSRAMQLRDDIVTLFCRPW